MPCGEKSRRLVIGAMTGTSLDAVDAVSAEIEGTGIGMSATLILEAQTPLGDTGETLRRVAAQTPMTAGELAELALELAARYAEAIGKVAGAKEPIDLIAVHGQTIVHRPPISWQLITPAPIATRFHCPVVFDLRGADLTAGGAGAPITPIADWVLFRLSGVARAVVNLGGFCNVTVLGGNPDVVPPDPAAVTGFDVCVCNQLLDEIARRTLDTPYDAGGRHAARGTPHRESSETLGEVLSGQRRRGRSLGTGDEAADWVAKEGGRLEAVDLAATAVDAVARTIAGSLAEHKVDEIVLAGGGAHNETLVEAIRRHAERPLKLSDDLGVPVQSREALAMAVLGALCADGIPITLPHVTGRRDDAIRAGSWCHPAG